MVSLLDLHVLFTFFKLVSCCVLIKAGDCFCYSHSFLAVVCAGIVKEILCTCVSVGCTVDGKDPKDLQTEINDGEVEIPFA